MSMMYLTSSRDAVIHLHYSVYIQQLPLKQGYNESSGGQLVCKFPTIKSHFVPNDRNAYKFVHIFVQDLCCREDQSAARPHPSLPACAPER
jgi:hypothetical protein